MRNLRKPCSVIHFRRSHGFYSDHFEIGHNDQLREESSIGNLILTNGIYLNQMVPLMETIVQKRTCCLRGGRYCEIRLFVSILYPQIYDLIDRKT